MIWFFLYILIATIVTFALLWASIKMDLRDRFRDRLLWPAVLCGIFWIVAAPIYAAYLAALWYSKDN